MQSALKYYFRTGKTKAFDNAYKNQLYDDNQKKEFDAFVALFGADAAADEKLALESTYIACVSKISSADKTVQDLVAALMNEYEIDEATATHDAEIFVNNLQKSGILEGS